MNGDNDTQAIPEGTTMSTPSDDGTEGQFQQERYSGPVQVWDQPMVDALDRIDSSLGAQAIEWGEFRFSGCEGRPHAGCLDVMPASAPEDRPVVFRCDPADHVVTVTLAGAPITPDDFAARFAMSKDQAESVWQEVVHGLTAATATYNDAHPVRVTTAPTIPEGMAMSTPQDCGTDDQGRPLRTLNDATLHYALNDAMCSCGDFTCPGGAECYEHDDGTSQHGSWCWCGAPECVGDPEELRQIEAERAATLAIVAEQERRAPRYDPVNPPF
ncbi:hypothetical protein [Mobilicoccus caccae]|uniref:Uncharacterized protein n=1 Tax=Mobilicoccus caccae TaxID=1859295 RepID=A0ABQ6IWS3_9MICO|nr:hypothetical protein [Mobilicoccus caccae]GMA42413.1 hypothetical protein GCM10025883_44580 [Mobilicoccus caccae]